MTLRYYANAPATTLSTSVAAGTTTFVVASVTGFPVQYPYTLIVDRGQATEEVVEVTAGTGTTLTVTRGVDSTTAFSHTTGATVEHGISARDVREPNSHIAASTAVHGITGSVVGTSDTQTLTNKTISADSNTISGIAASSFVLSNGSGNLDGAAAQKAIPAGAVVGTTDTQTLTNKDLSSGTNTFPAALATDAEVTSAVSTHAALTATHGVAGAIVGTSDTQTLTNKTLSTGTKVGAATTDISGAWTSYTPSWTAATANPAIGNGTITGSYLQIGKTVFFRATITMGGTTTYGTGQWRLSLPTSPTNNRWKWIVDANDSSLADTYTCTAVWNNAGGYASLLAPATTAGNPDRSLGAAAPFTWASGDTLTVSGSYEAA